MTDETEKRYIVRTLYLANFAEAAVQLAQERRNPTGIDSLRSALRKLEMADQTLEKELNAYVAEDCELIGLIRHDIEEQPLDLLVTAIFARQESSD